MNIFLITIECFRNDYFNKKNAPFLYRFKKAYFKRAYSTSTWTAASLKSILTSTYPLMHGEFIGLPEELITLPEILKKEGYKTGGFVKGIPFLSSYWNFDKGFDYYDEKEEKERKDRLRKIKKRVFERFEFLRKIYNLLWLAIKFSSEKSRDEKKLEGFFSFIGKNKNKKIFSWIHLQDSHEPYPNKNLFKLIKSEKNRIKEKKDLSKNDIKLIREQYRKGLRKADNNVGRIIGGLKDLGVYENSLVIICGDHGQEIFERKNFGHRPNFYEENINVPLIVNSKEIKKKEWDKPVSLIDIPTTILDILKIRKPGQFLGGNLFKDSREVISEDARKGKFFPAGPLLKATKYNFDYERVALIEKKKYVYRKDGEDGFYYKGEGGSCKKMKKRIEKHLEFEKKFRKKNGKMGGDKARIKEKLRELGYIK
jgi:arylsulfatase A-like enzyme